MPSPEDQRFKELRSKHQVLCFQWENEKKPCIICGESVGNEKDHLPPKVLLPKTLRNPKTEFFTYPVCTKCNRSSSDEDFLFYTIVAWIVNQNSYISRSEPTDPDLLALHNESTRQFTKSDKEQKRRIKLINKYISRRQINGEFQLGINGNKININRTLTKIVKSIYWLHTNGDILQSYNPGWWIYFNIDTAKLNFINSHLKTTHADIYWDNRFIVHYTIGQPQDNVGGVISCSLHFYTGTQTGKGISWLLIAFPTKTFLHGKSLYETAVSYLGEPKIKPQQK